MDKTERNRTVILSVLQQSSGPIHSARLAEKLLANGVHLSERTIRLYLSQLEAEGLSQSHGRRGRVITDKGRGELCHPRP